MRIFAAESTSLIELLKQMAPDSSQSTLRSWLEKGRVAVAGKVVRKGDFSVQKGAEVMIKKRPRLADEGVEILYEDRDLVVVQKPEGLLSVATVYDKKHTVHDILKRRCHLQSSYAKRVYPVHRLDRETSGVMVFAYSEKARVGLKEQFQEHTIDREYIAIVEGELTPEKGTWSSYLYEDENYVVRSKENSQREQEGRWAVTHYEVIACTLPYAFLRLHLETGRKNQIRVHCQKAGHPIVGDKKYGSLLDPIGRLALHATRLGFIHPTTGKKMQFTSSLPEKLTYLGKARS